ncbi:MAG: hypothetical protein EZS28_050384, partial [Streblomastix strix]
VLEFFDCLLTLRAPANGSARKNLFIAENQQQSCSSQEQGPSAYDQYMKALLVLSFMRKPEIDASLADQGFVPPIFDKNDPHFMQKQEALNLNMLSKQMTFEDLIQRFPAINNTFSKSEAQQKMNYAQMPNSQEERVMIFMGRSPRAWFIANSKLGQFIALLQRPSAPPMSSASTAQVAQGLVNTTERTKEGASAGDKVFQRRIQVILAVLDHHEEIDTTADIITRNTITEMSNFGKKWPKQLKCVDTLSMTQTMQYLEIHGKGLQNQIGGDIRIWSPFRNLPKFNQANLQIIIMIVPEQSHLQRARLQQ